MIRCSDDTLYTGISVDVARRLRAHDAGRGAKYTRGRGPVELLAQRSVGKRSDALRLESLIKRQPKDIKVWTLLHWCVHHGSFEGETCEGDHG